MCILIFYSNLCCFFIVTLYAYVYVFLIYSQYVFYASIFNVFTDIYVRISITIYLYTYNIYIYMNMYLYVYMVFIYFYMFI